MYCRTMDSGAPPTDPAKYDPGPQALPAPVVPHEGGELLPQTAGRDALEAVDQPRDGDLWREVDQQVHVVGLAVELDQLRYAYRLNPTPAQRRALARAFGCARVVFNDAIATRRAAHEDGAPFPTDGALSKALTAAKRTAERAWLAEVSAVVLQQALADANTAYRNFFGSVKGHPEGSQAGRTAVPVQARPGAVDPLHEGGPVPGHRRGPAPFTAGRTSSRRSAPGRPLDRRWCGVRGTGRPPGGPERKRSG